MAASKQPPKPQHANRPPPIAAPATPSADDEFVPEEEEEGNFTQGDGLMAAKAKRQSPARSPAVASPML